MLELRPEDAHPDDLLRRRPDHEGQRLVVVRRGRTASWAEVDDLRPVRGRAVRLLETHALRGSDSLQLAAALVLVSDRPDRLPFVTLDARLGSAAEREGFEVAGVIPE
jgi:hypothetical protein